MEKYLYEDLAQLESSHWWHISKRKLVLSLIDFFDVPHRRIVDVGCGAGQNMVELSKIGEAWGIDSSPEAVSFSKKRGLANVTLGTAEKTGLKKEFFDLVTLLDVLEHTDEAQTLKEIRRILKKGGYLIITVPAFGWLWSRWDEVLHHRRRYTQKNLRELLEKAGFEVKKSSYVYSFLVLPALIIRFLKSKLGSDYSSDFKLSSPLINRVFLRVAGLERKILFRFSIPFGTSVVCICKKAK